MRVLVTELLNRRAHTAIELPQLLIKTEPEVKPSSSAVSPVLIPPASGPSTRVFLLRAFTELPF
jgi:hypothetical protein